MNAKNEFFGKNIIITGASSGIGLATALYFLNCGATVLLAGRDRSTMESIFNKFKNARIAQFEINKDMNLFDFKTTAVELLGKIDILINCAGIQLDGDVEKTFPQDFDYAVTINLRSIFLLLRFLEKYFVEGASIINLSCLYGSKPMVGVISHAMSKAGLETLTKYAAADFASLGVRINTISPCPVETNSMSCVKVTEEEINKFKERMKNNIPLGRIARPDDIVKVIVFLASKRSEKITGQIIKVDGGRSLTSSGYVHYKGRNNMNSRVEPDQETLLSKINYFTQNKIFKNEIPKDEKELERYIEDKMSESAFSRRVETSYEINYTNTNKYLTPQKNIDFSQQFFSNMKSEQMDLNSKNNS